MNPLTLAEGLNEFKFRYPEGFIQREINGASKGTVTVRFYANGKSFDYRGSLRNALSRILKTKVGYSGTTNAGVK